MRKPKTGTEMTIWRSAAHFWHCCSYFILLEVRLQERLDELGWKPFKPNSKIQPNCCAKFVFGGNHDWTLEMAFGNQSVNLEKGADNSHLHRCEEIENWAKDVYDWCVNKYGLERGDSIEGRNVQHLHKRDYIRKLTKEAKQAEKAVKRLQSMMRHLESRIFSYRLQLEEVEKELISGKITLDRYEAQKADIQKLIAEYQTKLENKTDKLHAKDQELERLTADATKARSVVQPFRNHKVDFTPPQITEKVPLFGTDKWVERQNQHITRQFTEIVRKIESLYRNDAARQVEAAQHNVLADYGELFQLRNDVKLLTENNDNLKSTLETILDQLPNSALRSKIFAIAYTLIGGTPVAISSSGGSSTSDLPWDGRRPGEEEEAYRRRCLVFAIGAINRQKVKSYRRK